MSTISDVNQLHDLINYDERLYIKLNVVNVLGSRVMNARNLDINVDYLSMIYGYMEKFRTYVEIQSACLDIMLAVARTRNGISCIRDSCKDVTEFLRVCRRKNMLRDRVDVLLRMISSGSNESDTMIGAESLFTMTQVNK